MLLARWRVEQKRRDYRAGVIAAAVKSGPGKKGQRFSPGDWFASCAPAPMTDEDMLAMFEDIAAAQNAKVEAARGNQSGHNPD